MGSMRTNMLDAYKKGRKQQPRSTHANAKLTPAQIRSVRKKYTAGGVTQQALATEYGVSQRAISLIVRYETYKDV
jgi:DNA-binding transcriptional regulator YiaG